MRILGFVALALFLSGCATGTYREPAAAELPDDQLAVLNLDWKAGYYSDRYAGPSVRAIDGRPVHIWPEKKIYLMPGERSVTIEAFVVGEKTAFYSPVYAAPVTSHFVAEAGKDYILDAGLHVREEGQWTNYAQQLSGQELSEAAYGMDFNPRSDAARVFVIKSPMSSGGPDILIDGDFSFGFPFRATGFIWVEIHPGVLKLRTENAHNGVFCEGEFVVESSRCYFVLVDSGNRSTCRPPTILQATEGKNLLVVSDFLGAYNLTGTPNKLTGQVTEIWGRSGMTIEKDDGRTERIRVERSREGGYMTMDDAETFTRILLGKRVTVSWNKRDSDGEIRGEAFEAEGVDLSEFQRYFETARSDSKE